MTPNVEEKCCEWRAAVTQPGTGNSGYSSAYVFVPLGNPEWDSSLEGRRKNTAFIDNDYVNEYFIAKLL